MKRAKRHAVPKPRDPVARSPLLGKGGPHGKSTAAKRRADAMALSKVGRDPDRDG
ncbi:MAG: hypothetical protein ABI585_00935 [Betaproteobacteria bacterium]